MRADPCRAAAVRRGAEIRKGADIRKVMDLGVVPGPACAAARRPVAFVRDAWGFTHGGPMTAVTEPAAPVPDIKVSVRQTFGLDSDMIIGSTVRPRWRSSRDLPATAA